jgi:hypothetical protein
MQRHFARHVRAEARKALSPDAYALLSETAVDQLSLVEVATSIHRRHQCGSGFRVWGLPYNGLGPHDRAALRDALHRSRDLECPEVSLDEAVQLIGASERLGSTEGIEDAVEELASWVARGVVTHELRHVADENEPLDCPGCPDSLSPDARTELAAYLASFASRDVAYVSLLQACGLPEPGGARGPHQHAMAFVGDRLLPAGCLGGPPDDLVGRAGRLARTLYGRSLVVRPPADLPRLLRVLPRRATSRFVRQDRPRDDPP